MQIFKLISDFTVEFLKMKKITFKFSSDKFNFELRSKTIRFFLSVRKMRHFQLDQIMHSQKLVTVQRNIFISFPPICWYYIYCLWNKLQLQLQFKFLKWNRRWRLQDIGISSTPRKMLLNASSIHRKQNIQIASRNTSWKIRNLNRG